MNAGNVGYWLTHPDAVIYTVASALLWPVLIVEVVVMVLAVVEFGRFCYEVFWQYRKRDIHAIERAAHDARKDLGDGKLDDALGHLARIRAGLFFRKFFREVRESGDLSRARLLKRVSDVELQVSRRLEYTRIFIRLGPILGLMGTLIPISPALVALARGDVEALSSNLVVAFSTTVVGLLIGGLSYIVSVVRDRRYTQDISDIEFVLETIGS